MNETGNISKELSYDLDFDKEKGTVRISGDYDGKGANAGVYFELESEYFLDLIAEKIPGTIDNAVIGILKAALK